MMRWLEEDGHLSVFRAPSHYTNGNTRDREGRLISCEHDTRRVTRTELNGTVTVLIDRFEGKPLNAPNDVVVASDGGIWFTDPGYGIDGPYEGHEAEADAAAQRLSPRSAAAGRAHVVADDFVRPNGIGFSPDESVALHRRQRHLAWRPGAYPRFRGRWRAVCAMAACSPTISRPA